MQDLQAATGEAPGVGLRAGEDRAWGGGVICNLWGSPDVDLLEVVALR